ncbi:MAG: hypothetical protein V8S24_13485, partial [Gordonibacter pamelaeae]
LYVALTRASEALVVAMDAKAPAAGKPPAYPALVDDVRSALCGAADFPEDEALLEYGGSAPGRASSASPCRRRVPHSATPVPMRRRKGRPAAPMRHARRSPCRAWPGSSLCRADPGDRLARMLSLTRP